MKLRHRRAHVECFLFIPEHTVINLIVFCCRASRRDPGLHSCRGTKRSYRRKERERAEDLWGNPRAKQMHRKVRFRKKKKKRDADGRGSTQRRKHRIQTGKKIVKQAISWDKSRIMVTEKV